MPRKQGLGSIYVVTDDDTGMYRIGEVDGGWNLMLKSHIKKHGVDGLLVHLAHMSTIAIETSREIAEAESVVCCSNVRNS